jgi:site-specific DNA-cytosine methylase
MSVGKKEKINVLSLFDGMSCGQIALNKVGIEYENYFASEIDGYGIKVSTHNYPNTKHLGNVKEIDYSKLPKIDLLIGGSPCQSFSFAGKQKGMTTKDNIEILTLEHYLELKNNGFEFQGQSYLFWEYMNALTILKPKYFLLENVKMSDKWKKVLSKAIGLQPILICSGNISAQNRPRYYWTNIPNVVEPNKIDIKLKDILEKEVSERYNIKNERVETLMKFLSKNYKVTGKVPTLTTELAHSTGKNFYPKTLVEIFDALGYYRRLTPIEVERLQTVPDNYTSVVTDTERYRMLGNGWTVDVIAHIFSFLKGEEIFNNFSNEKV